MIIKIIFFLLRIKPKIPIRNKNNESINGLNFVIYLYSFLWINASPAYCL
jgi:hypothetical protein